MNDLPGTFDQLAARLATLEQRVYVLEHPSDASNATAVTEAAPTPEPVEGLSLAQAGGLFSLLGRALLGIAGAYVLRAVAESTSLPKTAVAAIAIAYAILWLVWAARVRSETWLPSAIYAGTSALILAPMLWELTLSFRVLSPWATAAILGAFVLTASALAWRRDLAPVVWVANGTAAATALALSIATHRFIPFIAALLLMVLICEYAAERNHELTVRPLVAAAADLAIWALIFIYAGPQSSRADYPALGTAALLVPGCTLFLIYAGSIALRTTRLGLNINLFETPQSVIAFLLALCSVLYFEPDFGAIGLGAVCLLLAAACYGLVFAVLRGLAAGRNFQIFAAWGTALLLTGSILCLPPLGVALSLGTASIAATLLGLRLQRLTLQVHGAVLLASAAIASGLLGYVFRAMAGTQPARLSAAVGVVALCALVCYTAGIRGPAESWIRQSLHLVTAGLAVCILAALLVEGLLFLTALGVAPAVYHAAFIRTLTSCAIALAVAFAASRWRRPELTRIAYAALAFVAAKLVFEDLRHGHLEFIAASIFLFAITLISVPRLAQNSRRS